MFLCSIAQKSFITPEHVCTKVNFFLFFFSCILPSRWLKIVLLARLYSSRQHLVKRNIPCFHSKRRGKESQNWPSLPDKTKMNTGVSSSGPEINKLVKLALIAGYGNDARNREKRDIFPALKGHFSLARKDWYYGSTSSKRTVNCIARVQSRKLLLQYPYYSTLSSALPRSLIPVRPTLLAPLPTASVCDLPIFFWHSFAR